MSQNLSSAAVVIGALRVNNTFKNKLRNMCDSSMGYVQIMKSVQDCTGSIICTLHTHCIALIFYFAIFQ